MYPQKSQIAKSLNTVFNDEAIQQYLRNSRYRLKHTWVADVTKLSELRRYFNPMSHITVHQHANFAALCLCQLEYCRSHTMNEQILLYFKYLEAFFTMGVSSSADKLKGMINRLEVKIMNSISVSDVAKSDIANFLKMAMLLGDRSLIYDPQTQNSLRNLCAFVS